MKRIDKAKIKTIIWAVQEYEKVYENAPIPTWNQVHFYNTAFWQLVNVVENTLGEKLCN